MPAPTDSAAPDGDIIGVVGVVQWWYGPIADRAPWVATWYLVASGLVSLVWAVAAIVLLSVSLPLVLLVIGVPVALAALDGLLAMGAIERRRARWMGETIEAPVPLSGRARWAGWRQRLGDPVRWRTAGYFLLAPLVYWPLVALTIIGWGASLYLITFPLWGWAVGVGPVGLIVSVLVGLALGGLGPRLAVVFGRLGVRYCRWLLGRPEVELMQERVDALAANREEILSAVASERRRIERNLHDGVQQHLVAMGIDLGLAAAKVESDPAAALELLEAARDKNRSTIGELRVIGRGLHPAVLDDRGLDAALSAVVAAAPIPIALDIDADLELPIDTAETAYFVASEAVTNVLKHAKARTASVRVRSVAGRTRIVVHDDGEGGADPRAGSGLAGIAARVAGVDGSMTVDSPAGGPTVVTVELPDG